MAKKILNWFIIAAVFAACAFVIKAISLPSLEEECGADVCDSNERCAIIKNSEPRCYTACMRQSDCATGEICVSMNTQTLIGSLIDVGMGYPECACVRYP
jgi:hypothetical protein